MKDMVVRFSVRQRAEHVAVMVLFTVLCLTGLPQKYYDAGASEAIIQALGGLGAVRYVHRLSGVLFAGLTAVHLAAVMLQSLAGRSPLTLVVDRKDFTDAMQTLRYYLGMAERPARFGRFDYRQKFEYWGLVMGGVVVIATGVVLMYPIAVAQWLPAQLIPAAKAAHSNEGLLAFLTIIVWHIYNAHLSPDVFPFDTSIFTGRISRERMLHEHPLEYEERFGPAPAGHAQAPQEVAAK